MKKLTGLATSAVMAAAIVVASALPAQAAVSWSGTKNCGTKFVAMTTSAASQINHYHESGGFWESKNFAGGLWTSGVFRGNVYNSTYTAGVQYNFNYFCKS